MSKIKRIILKNFKQFDDFSITCRNVNALVGPNNCGKSTILDSMRVASDIIGFIKRRNPVLKNIEGFGVCSTYEINQSVLTIPIENVAKNYSEEDSILEVRHQNGIDMRVQLHPDRPIRVSFLNCAVQTAGALVRAFPLDIVVVPTLGPFEREEAHRQDETVRTNENTRLAHRNFRNIWLRKSQEEFQVLAELVAESWPGIEILPPEYRAGRDSHVTMFYRDNRMEREVFWSGFGFQVWLQIMTHALRAPFDSVIVLDEPDIYLHPDLQRRLIRLLIKRHAQILIATHSTEIINELSAGDVLLVSSANRSARRVQSDIDYKSLFNYIGSSENAEFARLAKTRRAVFFEGQDRSLLRKFARKFEDLSVIDDPDTAFFRAGGFSRWQRIVEADWTLENMFGMQIKIVSIFDRDYRSEAECAHHIETIERGRPNMRCFVLRRKEIENYALVGAPLLRACEKRVLDRNAGIKSEVLADVVDELIEEFRFDTQAHIASEYRRYIKKASPQLDDATIDRDGFRIADEVWSDRESKLAVVPGKDFLSALSGRLQLRYGVSITITQILSEFRKDEVPIDLVETLRQVQIFLETD